MLEGWQESRQRSLHTDSFLVQGHRPCMPSDSTQATEHSLIYPLYSMLTSSKLIE